MARNISPERKAAYYAGMAISGIGIFLFSMPFWTIPLSMSGPGAFDRASNSFFYAFIGFAMIVGGQFVMNIGRAGLAGSGILLDPDRARKEQEPFSRMKGGMIRDGLEEAGLVDDDGLKLNRSSKPEQVVMIRCRECGKLNEEDSKFCQECGKKL